MLQYIELATTHPIKTLAGLVTATHHTKLEPIRAISCSCALAACLLLSQTLAKESDAGRYRLIRIILSQNSKLPSILISKLWFTVLAI